MYGIYTDTVYIVKTHMLDHCQHIGQYPYDYTKLFQHINLNSVSINQSIHKSFTRSFATKFMKIHIDEIHIEYQVGVRGDLVTSPSLTVSHPCRDMQDRPLPLR